MAKQGINPIEQHVEKIVLGVSVLLFAFVVFSYVISTPISVSVKGQTISPYDLDRQLGEMADAVAATYKRASFTPPAGATPGGDTEQALKQLRENLVVLDKMPTTMLPPDGWWPEMPKPANDKGLGSEGAHALASISAPAVSEVHTGVTNAVLTAAPVDIVTDPKGLAALLQSTGPRDRVVAGSGKDVSWAFLKLDFDLQQQYDIFRQNGYSREQANIILFMDVQVQRQRVYPDGSFGSWEDVNTYKTVTAKSAPTTIEVGPDGGLGQIDDSRIRQLFASLSGAQSQILYPLPGVAGGQPFPPYGPMPLVATEVATPIAPRLPGAMAPMAPRSAPRQVAAPRPTGGGGAARGSGGRSGGSARGGGGAERGGGGARGGGAERGGGGARGGGDRGSAGRGAGPAMGPGAGPGMIDPAALQAMNKAEQAYKQKRYTEALQLLSQARSSNVSQQPRFQKLEQEIMAAYQVWQQEENKRNQKQAEEEARSAEIWAYDFDASPGKVYRYRSRVVLFNVFSHPDIDRNELKNPQDGAQVSLVGDWSPPSEPIAIASPTPFFLTSASPTGESASVEVFRFLQGQWYSQTFHVAAGDLIGDIRPKDIRTNRPETDFRTGYAVVDIGQDPAAVVETDTSGDAIKVRKVSSPTLICMDDDGTIQEHWGAWDSKCQFKKELESWAKFAMDQTAAAAPAGSPVPAGPVGRAMPSPATARPGR